MSVVEKGLSLGDLKDELHGVLASINNYTPGEKPRKALVEDLKVLLRDVYDYNGDMAGYILSLFAPKYWREVFEKFEEPSTVYVRYNSLNAAGISRVDFIKKMLSKEIILTPCEAIASGDVFSVVRTKHPVGATPEYMAGLYVLQSASSALAPLVLDPKPHENVADLCAAPGGKTTYLAQLMENEGAIFAIEKNPKRAHSLSVTCQRMNALNAFVVNCDALEWPCNENSMHKVLLDAPCTGTGVIMKDRSIKSNRVLADFESAKQLQIRLLKKALHICKVGGTVVYSTCSFTVEENEQVLTAVNRLMPFTIEPIDCIGQPGFTSFKAQSFMKGCQNGRRIYPHQTDMSGLCIFKLTKHKAK